jgi:hypothetical protein
MPRFPEPRFGDPLALSSGAPARLALAGGVAALVWAAVAWAMAA